MKACFVERGLFTQAAYNVYVNYFFEACQISFLRQGLFLLLFHQNVFDSLIFVLSKHNSCAEF